MFEKIYQLHFLLEVNESGISLVICASHAQGSSYLNIEPPTPEVYAAQVLRAKAFWASLATAGHLWKIHVKNRQLH